MSSESNFQIPSGYERGICFGANWTVVISPYMVLYFIFIILVGGAGDSGKQTFRIRLIETRA